MQTVTVRYILHYVNILTMIVENYLPYYRVSKRWEKRVVSQHEKMYRPVKKHGNSNLKHNKKFNTLLVWKLDSMDKLQKNEKQDS